MENRVINYIKENRIFDKGDKVVVGVSGGADSLCLLTILNGISDELNLTICAVHVNHHIRGVEADADQEYVEDYCKKLDIPCKVCHIDAKQLAIDNKCSEEEAGRNARYKAFYDEMERTNANKIAVAHNLNDNSETIMFNLFRGTGIKGMTGIPITRGEIVRPIMCLSRSEIVEYLGNKGITYRTDSTNLSEDYSRNKIRNRVLPYLAQNINSNVVNNITKTGNEFREIEDYLFNETKSKYNELAVETADKVFIRDCISEVHPAISSRVVRMAIDKVEGKLKDIGRIHIEMILDLLSKNTGAVVNIPYGIDAKREYQGISVYKETCKAEVQNNPSLDMKMVDISDIKENVPELLYTKWIDCDKIKNELVLRKRLPGDYIVVDMKGSRKKLKDYFINEKIPRENRDDIMVVADGNHIVWIIGYRISSHYKITEETKKILKIEYRENIEE